MTASRARIVRSALFVACALASCMPNRTKVTTPESVDVGPTDPAVIARGEYLVKNVSGCGDCHTPRNAAGQPDMAQWLGGVDNRFDLVPDDDTVGAVSAPNLTPDATGLLDWSDAEIKGALLDGVTDLGKPLSPLMPSYVFHNMKAADADAIVAYLRSIPAVSKLVAARQTLPVPLTAAASPIADAVIPHTTLKKSDPAYAAAERGRYLATAVGLCMDCHSAWHAGSSAPLETSALFAGGRAFSAKEWAVKTPDGGDAPAIIYSYNITPDQSGIAGWTPQMVATLLRKGTDDEGKSICRPMPSGPMGIYGGLSDADARDIGAYVTSLPPLFGFGGENPECPR